MHTKGYKVFMNYYIYSHTTPDGKVYIGQSTNPELRWENGRGYEENDDFYFAIQKYGWNEIKHSILCTCETKAEADYYESLFIVALDSENSNCGYNKTNIKNDLLKTYTMKITQPYENKTENRAIKENIFELSGKPKSLCILIINEWVFNEKYRQIMIKRYLDGKTFQELSKEFGLSQQQLKTIVYTCTNRIKKHL